jgi:hypothetical protein
MAHMSAYRDVEWSNHGVWHRDGNAYRVTVYRAVEDGFLCPPTTHSLVLVRHMNRLICTKCDGEASIPMHLPGAR